MELDIRLPSGDVGLDIVECREVALDRERFLDWRVEVDLER